MKKVRIITGLILSLAMAFAFASCGQEEESADNNSQEAKTLHVATDGNDETGDGNEAAPFATVEGAIGSGIGPGSEIIVHEGTYEPFSITAEASGTEAEPVIIRAAEGDADYEKVVIKAPKGKYQSGEDGMEELACIYMTNVGGIELQGFETYGGTYGILYESSPEQGDTALEGVYITDCKIHDVVGAHGIAVYAGNDLAPVKNLGVSGCEVHDCLCGDSESLVLNGNIDGFTIAGNVIHDNNNIGIDMIGFEGTAKHAKGSGFDNPYDADFVRNGECHDNIVYNISAEGNPAYYEDGEYDLCADGIYVDGGQDIEIFNNFVFNCDIGLEVATEHSPDDNELFRVSGIKVHDNVVADCKGWTGLCFGGYDKDLGFTENCEFARNTFVDNETQVGVQRSKGNTIHDNLFVGEDSSTIEFNYDCREKDMINDFGANTWCIGEGTLEDYMDAGDYDIEVMMPKGGLDKQKVMHSRSEAIDGFKSLIDGVGSEFVPGEHAMKLYNDNKEAK